MTYNNNTNHDNIERKQQQQMQKREKTERETQTTTALGATKAEIKAVQCVSMVLGKFPCKSLEIV